MCSLFDYPVDALGHVRTRKEDISNENKLKVHSRECWTMFMHDGREAIKHFFPHRAWCDQFCPSLLELIRQFCEYAMSIIMETVFALEVIIKEVA